MTTTLDSPPNKKPRLESKKSDVVAPSDALPDEDTAAPISAAAGAHAKPFSAQFNPQPAIKANKGKGKAKVEDDQDAGEFHATLAKLDEGGKSPSSSIEIPGQTYASRHLRSSCSEMTSMGAAFRGWSEGSGMSHRVVGAGWALGCGGGSSVREAHQFGVRLTP